MANALARQIARNTPLALRAAKRVSGSGGEADQGQWPPPNPSAEPSTEQPTASKASPPSPKSGILYLPDSNGGLNAQFFANYAFYCDLIKFIGQIGAALMTQSVIWEFRDARVCGRFSEAFHLIAAGDSDLLEIVGLSRGQPDGRHLVRYRVPARCRNRHRRFQRTAMHHCLRERADGLAAGRGRTGRLPYSLQQRTARLARPPLFANGDDHRPDNPGRPHRDRLVPANRRRLPCGIRGIVPVAFRPAPHRCRNAPDGCKAQPRDGGTRRVRPAIAEVGAVIIVAETSTILPVS